MQLSLLPKIFASLFINITRYQARTFYFLLVVSGILNTRNATAAINSNVQGPVNTSVCEGATATFSVTASNNVSNRKILAQFEYYNVSTQTWLAIGPETNLGNGPATATLQVNASATENGKLYRAIVMEKSASGKELYQTAETNAATLKVYSLPITPTLDNSSVTTICSGSAAHLVANGAPVNGSYKWYNAETGGTLFHTGATYTPTLDNTNVTTATYNYYVAAVNSSELGGCEGPRKLVQVTVFPKLQAAFTASGVEVNSFEEVTLTYTGIQIPGASYKWTLDGAQFTPGDATSSKPITVKWPTTGAKTVSLTVSVNNCSVTETKEIVVDMSTLPVELVYFKAARVNDQIEFKWQTAMEKNNEYFSLEQSTNGQVFTELAVIIGAGNSKHKLDYHFVQKNAPAGLTYYRLKQTDFDGTFAYSEIVAVSSAKSLQTLVVYPNPGQGIYTLQGAEDLLAASVADATGRTIMQLNSMVQNSSHSFDLTAQQPGIYFLHLNTGSEIKTIRLLKQ